MQTVSGNLTKQNIFLILKNVNTFRAKEKIKFDPRRIG